MIISFDDIIIYVH